MASFLNQMQTWLMLPKSWRFVGFASALLGLLCFALSSSFNSLFGEWNHLKTFLYVIFCFIICIAVLFANVWQHSSSLRLEAHLAFLVLTITSFYTFFLDKAARGKPDAYSLVSCASFAVMSLSLSLQTHLGFEVDLLYFFLGALIVQLMKIKWLLGIAGAVFSYFLVILSFCLDISPEAEEDSHTELQDQPRTVIEVDSLQLPFNASSASALLGTPQEGNAQEHAMAEVEVDWHPEEVSDVVPLLVTSQECNTEDHAMAEVNSHSQEVNLDVALNEVGSQQLQSDVAVPGGIYSITCDVMRCIRKATEASFMLEQSYKVDPEDSNVVPLCFSLSLEIVKTMVELEALVEHKSSNCMEPALSYLTMMNNTMYIKQEVLTLMTKFPSGDGEVNLSRSLYNIFSLQIQEQTKKFWRSHEGYMRSSWTWVLGLLKIDSNDDESVVPDIASESIKEKLQSFNTQFFVIWYFQSKWFATDDTRKILIKSIKNMLLPAYGNFIERFQHVLGEHDSASIYPRMSESDIEAQLNQLFLGGNPMNQ